MLNVLIVDDSIVMRKKLNLYLAELGHNVVGEASNGLAAIDKCKELKPDLITMDITMPEMDGVEATKKIVEIDKEVNILMITALGLEEMIAKALQVGAKGYLVKPLSIENLEISIGKIFVQYKREEDLSDDIFLDD